MTAPTVYQPTASQFASAACHLERRSEWTQGRRKSDGRAFWIMPSSDRQRAYYVAQDGSACTCEGSRRYPVCAHQLAARMAQPKRRAIYAAIFPECKGDGCTDLSESADGFCDQCGYEREYTARMASKRQYQAQGAVR